MKKLFIALLMACLPLATGYARDLAVTMHKLTASGVGDSIGVIVISETAGGLRMTPYLQNMQPGEYQFSIHENVGCHSLQTGFETYVPGMAAGKVLWQMPEIKVNASGIADQSVEISNVSLTDLSQRSLVISKDASPTLELAGFDTERVACGSLEQY
ncbi:MAG: superoxide dismutase family protein [Thioalkalispiraceae bacterium]|jgi:Cu-Zn family superoxide dismutase